jgi:outer membrane protein assembly factor BamB
MQNIFSKNAKYNRIKALLAIATLTFLMASSTFIVLNTQAAIAWPDYKTAGFISVAPNPIGVGQSAVVNLWIQPNPQSPDGSITDIAASNVGYANVTITFTRPDGTNDTFMPTDESFIQAHLGIAPGWTESVGAMYFIYTPTVAGNWSVTFSFPGQLFTEKSNNDTRYYEPCVAQPYKFTVQTDPVNAGILDGTPYAPLPTAYWTNPININNREWAAIAGDWLISGYNNAATKYNPYSTGPTTGHIVWDTQQVLGGLMGGQWGSDAYYGGQTVIVMNGKVYYNNPYGSTFNCLDITTGKSLYTANGTVSRGIHFLGGYQVGAQQNEGIPTAYLINTGTWQFYDPMTGALVQTLTNFPSGLGTPWWDDGNPLAYFLSSNRLMCWNFSKVTNSNWATGLVYNVSMAQTGAWLQAGRTYTLAVYPDANVIVTGQGNGGASILGYNMSNGAFLWQTNQTYSNVQQMPSFGYGPPGGPYVQFDGVTSSYIGYDVKTGAQIWTAPVGTYPWGDIPAYYAICIGDVRYSFRYDGYLYAFSLTNGSLIWKSQSVGTTGETVEGTWTSGGSSYAGNSEPGVAADGKLYWSTQTNYRGEPMTRFNKLFCINATTGEFIWNVSGAIATTAVADGYLLGNNGDDGKLYCFGKGQTSTTVQTPLANQMFGDQVLITGKVLDQSPFCPGTPAVSDVDMTNQMNYYMQNNASLVNNPPAPHGVSVILTAIDSNGNTQNIGQTTTDSAGQYSIAWTPPIQGVYTVIATFAGSGAYWSSSAETAVNVVQGPTNTPVPTQATQSMADLYFVPAIAGILVAIIAVGAILAILMLRKRP